MSKALSIILVVVAIAGCKTPGVEVASASPRVEISEVVLGDLIRVVEASDRRYAAYCLGTREKYPGKVVDAPPDLIKRMSNGRAGVKPYSGCDSRLGVTELATGRPSVVLFVGPIECQAPNKCTAVSAYTEASLSGVAYEYKLERRGGRWNIVDREIGAVS